MNIDILILSESRKLAVIIENKIDSEERGTQLQSYRETVQRAFPHYQLLCVYLTRDGDPPSNASYSKASYHDILKIIQKAIDDFPHGHDHNVLTSLNHYHQMINRHIVTDRELTERCQAIYRKHKKAIELIMDLAGWTVA